MKCPNCGHESGWSYEKEKEIEGEKFIEIKGNFTREMGDGWRGKNLIEAYLYACPKCHVVILAGDY